MKPTYEQLQEQLENAKRELRSADITMQNLEDQLKQSKIDADCYKKGMEASNARLVQLAAENAHMQQVIGDVQTLYYESDGIVGYHLNGDIAKWDDVMPDLWAETPATDAFLAEVRAQAHKEGAHFVANRMLAAWDAGFIDDTAKNAADIARMILASTEFMADAPEGDFDRSFADGVLEDIATQLRKGDAQ